MRKIVVEFFDEETIYARIQVEETEIESIKEILDEYREKEGIICAGYNITDFLEILKEKGQVFEVIPMSSDYNIYF